MRFLSALLNDVRFQVKYGFYFLYAFFSAIYIALLLVCPQEYKKTAAAIIILSDPAMLGSFFIGGIWLLEKGEGLHRYWVISPLRTLEYILSKSVSLALISTIAANLIVAASLKHDVNYAMLTISTFVGSMVFTVIGLIVATYAQSVNQYMILVSPLEIIITTPPILAAFGIWHPALDVFPGMALWHIINYSIGKTSHIEAWLLPVLLLWFFAALLLAYRCIPPAMQAEGGDKA